MDDSSYELHARRMRYENDACRRSRRNVIRRLLARLRRRRSCDTGWRGPDFGGEAGVREPRRPYPGAGSAAVALELPRSA